MSARTDCEGPGPTAIGCNGPMSDNVPRELAGRVCEGPDPSRECRELPDTKCEGLIDIECEGLIHMECGELTDTECEGLAGIPGLQCSYVVSALSVSPHSSLSFSSQAIS